MQPSRVLLCLAVTATAGLGGCAGTDRTAVAGPSGSFLPVPSPPGWFAFCAAHGGTIDGMCDPVPRAAPMSDGRAAPPPAGWTAYCRRHGDDDACAR